jgi:predicted alpha/beta hydrolase
MATRTSSSARPLGAAPTRPIGTAAAGAQALVCEDGRVLAASWHEPPQGEPHAVAVVSAATGVPRGYYRAFAQWLAQRGYAVLTYDYRGIAESRRGPIRSERAVTMRDWAVLDMSAAIAAANARRAAMDTAANARRAAMDTAANARRAAPGAPLPLLLIGHSFGGNAIMFARGVETADAILTVASQLGDWRLWPGVHRWVTGVFFHAWLPAVAHLFGHAPGWSLGGGAQPLPAGVALQWAAWGRRRGWAFADPQMRPHRAARAVVAPVHVWNVSDDLTFAPPRAVDALAVQFANAAVQRHTLVPTHVGATRLGHFGAFRREVGEAAWQRLLAPLEAAVPALRPPAGS